MPQALCQLVAGKNRSTALAPVLEQLIALNKGLN